MAGCWGWTLAVLMIFVFVVGSCVGALVAWGMIAHAPDEWP